MELLICMQEWKALWAYSNSNYGKLVNRQFLYMQYKRGEGDIMETGHFIVLSLAVLLILAPSFGILLC